MSSFPRLSRGAAACRLRERILLFPALFLAAGGPWNVAFAADFFVDAVNGSVGGDGSAGTPWLTITQAMTSGSLGDGDVVHVASGTYDAALGEAFPIAMVSGVDLRGPGDGSADVVHQTARALSLDEMTTGTTIVQGLDFSGSGGNEAIRIDEGNIVEIRNNSFASDNTQDIRISDLPTELLIDGNQASVSTPGGGRLVDVFHNNSGLAQFTISNNVVTDARLALIDFTGAAEVSGTITGNQVTDGTEGVGIDFRLPAVSMDLLIENNTMVDVGNGVDLRFSGSTTTTANATCDVTIRNNTITDSVSSGLFMTVFLTGSSVSTDLDLNVLVENNTVTGGQFGAGLRFEGLAEELSDSLDLDLDVRCNTFAGAPDEGVNVLVRGQDDDINVSVDADVELTQNAIDGNGLAGILFDVIDRGNDVDVQFNAPIRGNTITNNGGPALAFSYSFVSADTTGDVVADLGTALDFGFNTFSGNGSGLSFAKKNDAFPHVTFPAHGDWWGTLDLNDIEDEILHFVDDPDLGFVEVGTPLPNSLTFLTGTQLSPLGGESVTVTAGALSGFVSKAGSTAIDVTLGGVPVDNLVVDPDFGSLTFDTPVLPFGPVHLEITNPGGQTGAILAEIAGMTGDVDEISEATGGSQVFNIDAGDAHADKTYLVLGSLAGTSPGFPAGDVVIPLVVDNYFLQTLNQPNTFIANSFGTLDGSGQATATLSVPPGVPAGSTAHHAYVVFDPFPTPVFASNPVPLTIVP